MSTTTENKQPKKCACQVETYSRVCGFFRPVQQWNKGKQEEFSQRKNFKQVVVDDR